MIWWFFERVLLNILHQYLVLHNLLITHRLTCLKMYFIEKHLQN